MATTPTCLFLDIGGVLLSNGWGHESRALAARTFGLNLEDLEKRHHQAFDTFEIGRLTLAEYLDQVVFHRRRPFTHAAFTAFMFAQSTPHPQMIALIRRLKRQHGLKVVVVSNEGRELNEQRFRRFKLGEFVDFFVSSCYVGLRKPDPAIFRMALDCAQVPLRQIVYIEDSPMHLKVAKDLGMRGILHTDHVATAQALAGFGLGTGLAKKPGAGRRRAASRGLQPG